MAASMKLAAALDSLPNSDDKIAALEDIKTLLATVGPATLRDVVPNTSFDVIFECLHTEDGEQVRLCCGVLSLLLSGLHATSLLTQFHSELLAGLNHPDDTVKELCLTQIVRAAEESPQQLGAQHDLIVQTTTLIAESLALAKLTEKVFVTLGQTSEGLESVFQQPVVDKLHEISTVSDTIRFRVYEVVVRVMCVSEEALVVCSRTGLLQQLVNEVYKDDLLTQLNSLELLKDLVLTPHGLRYLDDQGTVGKLEELLVTAQTDALAGFLLPGLVKFFGNVASLYPKEVCGRFKDFMSLVFELIQGQDISLAVLAGETLAVISTTLEGKLALEKQGNQMLVAMKQIGHLINNSPTEIRVRALTVIATLISLQGEQQTVEMLSLTETWFSHLMPRPVDKLQSIVTQPFSDLRLSAGSVIATLADLPWGQRLLHEQPSFTEYLLDRSTEKTKEGKDSKYAIVKALAESPTASGIFGAPTHMKFKQYVNDGPYYVRVEAAVAFEEES